MYAVVVKKKAAKEIEALPKHDQRRIIASFDILRENPFVGKQLEGEYEGARVIRVWPYRVIYVIHRSIVTVTVLRVGQRQGVYK